jgi:plasmid stabilization system protein ParE
VRVEMMNDRECTQAYKQLGGILDEIALGWVIAQVSAQVKIGKAVQREIETLRENRGGGLLAIDEHGARLKKGPRATFAVTVEYTPSERLELLIDAIKQAVVSTAQMEDHLVGFCERDQGTPKRIEFRSEEPEGEHRIINRQTVAARLVQANKLNELLEALRKEI